MRLVLSGALVTFLAGAPACSPTASEGDATKAVPGKSGDEKKATPTGADSPLEAVERFVDGLEHRKPEKAEKMLDADATWRLAGTDESIAGAPEILKWLQARNFALRLRLNAKDYFVVDDVVVLGGAWIGVHVDEFAGVAPTKEGVGVEGAVLFRTDGRRITEVIEYFDASSPYAQVGVLPKEKVWAQRSDISVVVAKHGNVHDTPGSDATLAHLERIHAGFLADPPVAPTQVTEHFAYWESSTASAATGATMLGQWTALRTAIPDLSITVEEKWTVGDAVVARTRWKGTHSATLRGWLAKGAKLDIECLEVVRLEADSADSWTVHFNGNAVLKAMGVVDGPAG